MVLSMPMMNNNDVKVACRKCGKQVNSSELKLDNYYRMMVCPNCVKQARLEENRKNQPAKIEEDLKIETQKSKPVGWDAEDEYLNNAVASKDRATVKVERLDAGRVKYTCPKCKYSFAYDTERKHPASCPYCGTQIFRFKL